MSETIKRKVVKSTFHQSKYSRPGSGTIQSVLECGHRVYTKSSKGHASHRFCRTCGLLANGAKVSRNGVEEKWDAERQMPAYGTGMRTCLP